MGKQFLLLIRHSTYYSYIQSSPVNVLAVKSKRSLSFEIWVSRNGQPDRDDDRKIFVAMTSTKKQRILVWVAFASASELQNITTLGTSSKITYELWNVISIRWWCWNVATDERDVDYWKSEIITFVVDFFLNLPPLLISRWRSRKEADFWVSVVSFTSISYG
jgi:hypothetical protein